MARLVLIVVAVVALVTACGDADPTIDNSAPTERPPETTETTEPAAADEVDEDTTSDVLHPDVVGVEAVHDGGGSWTFHVTLSSPYDRPDRYADAWRVVGPEGMVYGERILLHDHAAEQPFTRSQSGIQIPDDVTTVIVEGRDQISGWGGATIDVTLER